MGKYVRLFAPWMVGMALVFAVGSAANARGSINDSPYKDRRTQLLTKQANIKLARKGQPITQAKPAPPPIPKTIAVAKAPKRAPMRIYMPNPEALRPEEMSIGATASMIVLEHQLGAEEPAAAPAPAPVKAKAVARAAPAEPIEAPAAIVVAAPVAPPAAPPVQQAVVAPPAAPLAAPAPLTVEQAQPVPRVANAIARKDDSLFQDIMNVVASPVNTAIESINDTLGDAANLIVPRDVPAAPAQVASAPPPAPATTPLPAPEITHMPPPQAVPAPPMETVLQSPEPVIVVKRETVNLINGISSVSPERVGSVSELSALIPAAGNEPPPATPQPLLPPTVTPQQAQGMPPLVAAAVKAQEAPTPVLPPAPPPAPVSSEPAPSLAPETRRVLEKMPSNLDTPKSESLKKITIDPKEYDTDRTADSMPPSTPVEDIKVAMGVKGIDITYEVQRAYDALMQGQTDIAVQHYLNVLKSDADNQQALFGLAATYHRVGQLEKARPLYVRLLKQNPTHRDGLNNFLALAADEAPEEALRELQQLADRNPDFSPIPAQMALINQKLGNYDQAIQQMTKAVSMAPENLTYRYNLAILFDRLGRYEEAASLYKQLVEASIRGEAIPGKAQAIQERLTFLRSNKT